MVIPAAVDPAFDSMRSIASVSGQDTPTTPRPAPIALGVPSESAFTEDDIRTPTLQGFAGDDHGRQSLLDVHITPGHASSQKQESTPTLKRDVSLRSPPPQTPLTNRDVDMAEGDDGVGVEDEGSDNDSITSDSQRPSKKKKGQRFFCTDFPPCQLSFTRSEHLARHIRKHTGERPFQCHCSRRFSRLDNLRQHAQTVHLNEEIPGDSLAATSTRFQRQIRTDRVRPQTSRSRASTIGSNGGHSRGHSRNLSASSIASSASSVGPVEDTRRRPQPLAMANDPSARAHLSLETYNHTIVSSPQAQYGYYAQSPSGFSSPTSTAFSIGGSSPRFQSGIASPVSTISRPSYYNGITPARRLSVPAGPNPFHTPHLATHGHQMYYNPMPPSSPGGAFSQNSSVFASPTTTVFSHSRRDLETEMDLRRRTWHPNTYSNYSQRLPTSGLSYQQTPDDHRPAASNQLAASQMTRLPGIESFDHAPRPGSQQAPEPLAAGTSPRVNSSRPSDAGLHQNLTRLDIAAANASHDSHWQAAPQRPRAEAQAYMGQQTGQIASHYVQATPTARTESPVTPRRSKRQAWYGGPVTGPITPQSSRQTVHRPSPEDSGSSDGVPTPGTTQGIEYHPVIVTASGAGEPYSGAAVPSDEQKAYIHGPDQSSHQTYALQSGHDPRFVSSYPQPANNDMGRLEALVAVATSENRAAEQRS